VDADDWIEPGAIRRILEKVALQPDVIVVNFVQTTYGEAQKVPQTGNEHYQRGIDLLQHRYPVAVYCHIVSRDLLTTHGLVFHEGICHEDLEFTPRVLYFAQHIEFIDEPLYVYCKHPNSITTTPSPRRIFDLLQVAESLYRFLEVQKCVVGSSVRNCVAVPLCHAFEYTAMSASKSIQIQFLSELPRFRPMFRMMMQLPSRSYKFRGLLFLYTPKLALRFLRLYYKRRAARLKRHNSMYGLTAST
jgi:hypothetical protein